MTSTVNYDVKAFDWQGNVYAGTFSFGLTESDSAPHLDQTTGFALGSSTPVTFDAFTIAGTLTIQSLGLQGVAFAGLEYVSPMGPPLCMIFVAPEVSGVTLALFPGDPTFETVEGPLAINGQVYTMMGQQSA